MKNIFFSIIFIFFSTSCLFGQEVVLIRHAEVQLDHTGWMSAKRAATLRKKYDTAPVYQFAVDSVLAKIPQRITDTVYVSGLSRSIVTGLKLYGDSANIVSLDILNEFELHMIWLPVFLPYKSWTGLSRSMWLLGLEKRGTESYREAKKRVKTVAGLIEEKANTQNQVILVTHGFINRNIAKELKHRGWKVRQNAGKENLGATILKR